MAAEELVLDEGVLEDARVCEFQGMQAVRRCGGLSVLSWRADWHKAEAYELRSVSSGSQLQDARFAQCLVHLQKSRPATWQDLGHAWATGHIPWPMAKSWLDTSGNARQYTFFLLLSGHSTVNRLGLAD